jgi:hypothetical protein
MVETSEVSEFETTILSTSDAFIKFDIVL